MESRDPDHTSVTPGRDFLSQYRSILSFFSAWLLACVSGGGTLGGDSSRFEGTTIPVKCQQSIGTGVGVMRVTVTGGTTVDGVYEMCGSCSPLLVGGITMSGKIEVAGGTELFGVDLGIPISIYTGASTYTCGFEENTDWESGSYCNVHAAHRLIGPNEQVDWELFGSHQEGVFPDCGIDLQTSCAEGATGSFHCANIPVGAVYASNPLPNENTTITLNGTFEYTPRP